MRKTLLFCVFCLLCTLLHAENIGRNEARKAAQAFLQTRGRALAGTDSLSLAFHAPRKTLGATAEPDYYIFNAGNGGGFVVVSGDARTERILGYTDRGSYDPDSVPEALAAWLAFYAAEIERLAADTTDTTSAAGATLAPNPRRTLAVTEWAKNPVSPLLLSTWNQLAPYNNAVPEYTAGKKSATGCVATAMAQLMYYHRWPAQTVNNIAGYTSGTHNLAVSGLPAGTPIDWENMIDSYRNSYTDVQAQAVANLMLYCGTSVGMNYGESSGAFNFRVAEALKNSFGYDEDITQLTRSSYTAAEWEAIIYKELQAGRPVYYGGYSSSVGHAFLCDGYDAEGLFHINWGWGGMANGYFRLSVMNPGTTDGAGAGSSGDGYAMNQNIIIGIQKPDGISTKTISDDLYLPASNLTYTGGYLYITYENSDRVTASFDFGIAHLQADGSFIVLDSILNYNVSESFASLTRNFMIRGRWNAGTYHAFPVSRLSTSTRWQPAADPATFYADVVVTSKKTAPTVTICKPVYALTATDFSTPGSRLAGSMQEVQVKLTNNGTSEFNNILYLFASQTTTPGTAVNKTGAVVEGGTTETVAFFFTPSSGGTYNLWLCKDAAGTDVIGTGTVTFEALTTGTPSLQVVSSTVSGVTNARVYGKTISGTLRVKNTGSEPFAGTIDIYLFAPDDAGVFKTTRIYSSHTERIESGATFNYNYSFENIDHGVYKIYAYRYLPSTNTYEYLTGSSTNQFVLSPGFLYWTADGNVHASAPKGAIVVPEDAVAVSLEGVLYGSLYVTSVTPNSNPNTLYIFADGDDVPTSLNGRNIVQDGLADDIVLKDGYNFYSPVNFTATNIRYERTVGNGTSGSGGWETLVLPFTVDQISKQDGTVIDWIRAKGGKGKFWLKEFAGIDENDYVYFGYSDALRANRPYIVAFPGDALGEKWSLANQKLTFSAQNASVRSEQLLKTTTSAYRFLGTTLTRSESGAYMLNTAGTAFLRTTTATPAPFRAWFMPVDATSSGNAATLTIGSWDGNLTGIDRLRLDESDDAAVVYDLSGRPVRRTRSADGTSDLSNLPGGIYIVNGQKIIIP